LRQGVPLLSRFAPPDPKPPCWGGWRPQLGDLHQRFLEHLPPHGDLGHLDGDVPAVAENLGADLVSFSGRTLVSDHGSTVCFRMAPSTARMLRVHPRAAS